jgi:hypothetical protein
VTCCKVDKNSGRDASDEIRWPKIAMQQVSRNLSVLRLHDSFTMPLLLLCGLWVSKSLFPKVAHATSRLSLEPMHRGQETVLGMRSAMSGPFVGPDPCRDTLAGLWLWPCTALHV